jgi:hypothetical protein
MGWSPVCFDGRNKSFGLVVPAAMRHETVTIPAGTGVDWKGLGYLISIASVFFLGAIAWPKPGEAWWHLTALIIGMATSIIGMGCRYKAHLDMRREMRKTEVEAKRR